MSVYIPPLGETNIKKLTFAIHQLAQGRTNSNGTFTITPNSTSTTVKFVTTSPSTFLVLWQPTTANAAAQMATLFCTGASKGQFVISHSPNPHSDMTFNFVVMG